MAIIAIAAVPLSFLFSPAFVIGTPKFHRFGIFKRKREKKIMVMLMLPKEQWV